MLAGFARPFKEQVAALELRLANLRPTARWDDLWQQDHDLAFVIAGATKADLLADLASAVEKSIAHGGTLEQFRADFRGIVEARGWHGWTGEGTAKGEAWRTRIIYKTNMSASYAAGRFAQLKAGGFKYWVYHHGNARDPRIEHLGWDGLVLTADHPFWVAHYPPNGWGCTCYVSGARTEALARRRAGKDVALPDGWNAISPKTGAPIGIDKGWAYAPGASVADAIKAITAKLEVLVDGIATDLIRDLIRSRAFQSWLGDPKGSWPMVKISAEDAAAIGAKIRVASISEATLAKQSARHEELSTEEYVSAQRVIDGAQLKLTDRDPKTGTLSRIFILEESKPNGGGYVLVVKATLSGDGLWVTSYRRLSKDQAARDSELKRLIKARQRSESGGNK
jgi:hypothetical protein